MQLTRIRHSSSPWSRFEHFECCFTKLKKIKTQILFSPSLGNPWDQSQFLNPGSHCLPPILITSGATDWQLQHLQGLKTNLDSTYLSSSRHPPWQRSSVGADRRTSPRHRCGFAVTAAKNTPPRTKAVLQSSHFHLFCKFKSRLFHKVKSFIFCVFF